MELYCREYLWHSSPGSESVGSTLHYLGDADEVWLFSFAQSRSTDFRFLFLYPSPRKAAVRFLELDESITSR